MADVLSTANEKIFGGFGSVTQSGILTILGWILFFILLIGGSFFAYITWKNKKQFCKTITAFEVINGQWQPVIRDTAKIVKLGKGGFEVLFLKKQKTYRIAYGGKVGKDTYYFFIMPDGYWYNGSFLADLKYMDKVNGLVQVITTNSNMRANYTALEKQIDALQADKKNWLKENAMILVGAGFIIILGVIAWFIYKDMSSAMGTFATVSEKMGLLVDKINGVASNMNCNVQPSNSGLIPV